MVIGITGGIATGKTFVSNYIKEKGYPVFSSDEIAGQLMVPGGINYKHIVHAFGEAILNMDGTINRKKLGDIIFSDGEKRNLLNNITHPNIIAALKAKSSLYPIVFLEIPLLFEVKLEGMVDEIWVAICCQENQEARLMARDQLTKEDANLKMKSQLPLEHKKKGAHVIIDTDKSKEAVKAAIDKLLVRLENKK